jgi:hypothetical protein
LELKIYKNEFFYALVFLGYGNGAKKVYYHKNDMVMGFYDSLILQKKVI